MVVEEVMFATQVEILLPRSSNKAANLLRGKGGKEAGDAGITVTVQKKVGCYESLRFVDVNKMETV